MLSSNVTADTVNEHEDGFKRTFMKQMELDWNREYCVRKTGSWMDAFWIIEAPHKGLREKSNKFVGY